MPSERMCQDSPPTSQIHSWKLEQVLPLLKASAISFDFSYLIQIPSVVPPDLTQPRLLTSFPTLAPQALWCSQSSHAQEYPGPLHVLSSLFSPSITGPPSSLALIGRGSWKVSDSRRAQVAHLS